ncbi:MAG: hypothetical protein ACO39C_00410 [Chthoniobacterales bacterium]
MDWGLAIANVLNPAAVFFALGFAAALARATNRWAHAPGLGTLWGDGA